MTCNISYLYYIAFQEIFFIKSAVWLRWGPWDRTKLQCQL